MRFILRSNPFAEPEIESAQRITCCESVRLNSPPMVVTHYKFQTVVEVVRVVAAKPNFNKIDGFRCVNLEALLEMR